MSNDGEPNTPKPVLGRYLKGEGTLAPGLDYWLAGGLGIAAVVGLHSYFRRPKPRVPTNSSFFWPYAVTSTILLAADTIAHFASKNADDRVARDRTLQTVSGIARQQAREWVKTKGSPLLASLPPDDDPAGLGQYAPRGGLNYLAWKVRGHFWLDDRAWNYFYRTLAMPNATKYPDISPADWDICVSHIARGVFLEEFVVPVRGYTGRWYLWMFAGFAGTQLFEMRPRVWPPAVVLRGLHILWGMVCYGWVAVEVLPHPAPAVYLRPLTRLQNKTGVAEMLREVYPGSGADRNWWVSS